MTAIDLFAGCGGLSLGFEKAGWSVIKAYESNPNAALIYNLNLKGECETTHLSKTSLFPTCDLLLAGPPCQPFSSAGNQRAEFDPRDGVPIFLQALRSIQPRFGVMENVPNLKKAHAEYVDRIVVDIESMGYTVSQAILDSSEFGVAQRRQRFFLVAHHGEFNFDFLEKIKPILTVLDVLGEDAFDSTTAQTYPDLVLTPSMDVYIKTYEDKSKCKQPRDLNPNQAARTLTCRNLHGRTSDMIRLRLQNGVRRQITVDEAAKLSGFPSTFVFPEDLSRSIKMKCIGNAVPPPLAYALGKALIKLI